MEEEIITPEEEVFDYHKLRYILDNDGYIFHASFGGLVVCDLGECTEYNGEIPDGYETIEDWHDNEIDRLNAWKVVEGNLVFDENKNNDLQERCRTEEEENATATHKWVRNQLGKSSQVVVDEFSNVTNGTSLIILNDSGDYEIPKLKVSSENVESCEVLVSNKNLLGNDAVTQTINGITFTINEDKTITLKGTATANIELNLKGTSNNLDMLFLIQKDINYVVGGLANGTNINLYNFDGTDRTLIGTYGNQVISLTDSEKVTQATLNIVSGTKFESITIKPQIEINDAATDYVVHEENKVDVSLYKNEATASELYSYYPTSIIMTDEEVNIEVNYFRYKTLEKELSNLETTTKDIKASVTSISEKTSDLESSINYFSVDLSQYNLTIPTDSSNKPLETKNYDVNFYGYYKGKQVTPEASIDGSNTGITASVKDTYIRFAVSSSKAITNASNEYTITFTYDSASGKYTLTKKVNIALAIKGGDGADGQDGYTPVKGVDYFDGSNGKDGYTPVKGKDYFDGENGADGKSSYQIWLDQGNTGTEQDYLNSLKGQDGQNGKDGVGTPGKDGTSAYFYVRYSANANGSSMTTAPTSTTKYMGVASTTSSTAPTSSSAYTWSLIKGADGVGTPGKDGENGLTSYLHIKYSEDGTTFTPATDEYAIGKKPSAWIGQYVDYSETDSNDFDDYEWYKFTETIDETIEQMQTDINSANESINNTYAEVVQLQTEVTQDREAFKVSVEELTQTVNTNNSSIQESIDNINNTLVNGVETLKNTLVTINIDGISVATNVSKISTLITNNTFAITSSGTNLAYFGYDEENGTSIAEMDNLTIHNYFTAGYHRTEKFEIDGEKRTGIFFVGGDE